MSETELAIKHVEFRAEFDVFLAHHSVDKPPVRRIAAKLRAHGINPWIDEEQIAPGRFFQEDIERAIGLVGSAAIIIGKQGLGRWQRLELMTFVGECVDRELPVIPVLLPGAEISDGIRFLRQLSRVQFTETLDDPDAIDLLRWGITGERPTRSQYGR